MQDQIIELHIPSLLGSEKLAMEQAAKEAKKMGFSDDRIEDLKTAVSEACTNAIEHGNKCDEQTMVSVTLTPADSSLTVTVEDEGEWSEEEFQKAMKRKPALKECPQEPIKKSRGWGVFLIRKLVSEVSFEQKEGGGKKLTMIIHLTQ
jgi:serine/threonine-protein kinase RsbW